MRNCKRTELGRLDSYSNGMEVCNIAKRLKTEETDRISALPDDVVSHILSFLSTKQAVATSVLSKRWRSVWTLTPDLQYVRSWSDIDHTNWRMLSEETESFLRFFWDRVKPLDKSFGRVRLLGFFDDRLGDLVMEIMARKVRELDVATRIRTCANFRCSLLSSETLVSLKLHLISFPVELSVHLPRLKILHLDRIGKISEKSFREFISGCPVLEDCLLCWRKSYRSPQSLPILFTSQTLVSLKLAHGIVSRFPSPIYLPCLKSLHLEMNKMVNPECISQLLSGCPVLENFSAVNRGAPRHLPYNLFVLKSLVSLKLKGTVFFYVPHLVHLPCLKIFHLEWAWTMHHEFLGNLLAGCPVLEDVLIGYDDFMPIKLPYNLFISKTLVSLQLDGGFPFHVPSFTHLPFLRFLHLEDVDTMNVECLHNLLSGCPVLKIMHLGDARRKWSKNLSICIPTLEYLKLDLWFSYPTGYKLEIIAPALKDLRVHFGSCFNGETAWKFPSIEKASVDCVVQFPRDLLSTIQNAKVLELGCGARGYRRLPEDIKLIPKFPYLEFLQIRHSPVIFGQHLPKILENSPNLKKLIIMRELYDRDCEISWSPPLLIPYCLLHSLKAFSINCFRGLNGEMQMMNYILSSARMLEEVKVKFFILDADQKLHVQDKLSAVPRCSSTSVLQFF